MRAPAGNGCREPSIGKAHISPLRASILHAASSASACHSHYSTHRIRARGTSALVNQAHDSLMIEPPSLLAIRPDCKSLDGRKLIFLTNPSLRVCG
jgi:hypothetical protein